VLGIAVEAAKKLVCQRSKQSAPPVVYQKPNEKKGTTRAPKDMQTLHYYRSVQ